MEGVGEADGSDDSGGAASVRPCTEPQVLRYCDFRDFIRHLGIDPHVDANGLVMVAAHHMFDAMLPPDWSEHIDEGSSRVYFFNKTSGESLWAHPQEAVFKEIIADVRCWRPDEPLQAIFARSEAHLRRAHQRAVEAISQWTAFEAPQGPEEAPEFSETAQFYFNSATGESRWADPRLSLEFDLQQRHAILCECVSAHAQTLARMALPSDSSDGEGDVCSPDTSVQAIVQDLWQSIGKLPLPARPVEGPPAAPPSGGVQRSLLPAGDDTVRSTLSYLTARSSISCCEGRGDLF